MTFVIITAAITANDVLANTLFSAIPPKKPSLYVHARTSESWRNPSLRIRDDGLFVNESKAATPPDKLLETLAKLPVEAWPYGRIVAISAFPGLNSHKDAEAQKAIMERILAILKSADLEADIWPSA